MSLPPYRCSVLPEWIDYNGHMSEAFYVLAFGDATTAVMAALGLDEDYRTSSNWSLYTVEAHVRYLREASLGEELEITTVIVASRPKKLHLAHEMHRAGKLIATEEILGLHVDQASGSTIPFPAAVLGRIEAHGQSTRDWSGRSITA
ncbi:thioesterase family protein [Paeniglutamicibacter gangotriensis]|uniref:Bifunctional 3-hydroxyacyl-CoA dehydrogenase/thioesterase n=1 Tax=Paeniglutamicibacter gangotriensis Lz1y TaxID=1276920 RepID=M7MS25_9MICC|nr:thioesterase family protein [Paeniglutamicibacter gangotriensis]EMQ97740.1 bifunctional 3-hydroxyacyl-CoA dehydrogenase/thioesterase [Paeniglutamicibacter gangotriensis Lz1y]